MKSSDSSSAVVPANVVSMAPASLPQSSHELLRSKWVKSYGRAKQVEAARRQAAAKAEKVKSSSRQTSVNATYAALASESKDDAIALKFVAQVQALEKLLGFTLTSALDSAYEAGKQDAQPKAKSA